MGAMNRTAFAERLKQIRLRKGLTQSDVAQALNYKQQTIWKWESGKASPDPDTLCRIADVFKIPVSDLLTSSQVMESSAFYGSKADLLVQFFRSDAFNSLYDLKGLSPQELEELAGRIETLLDWMLPQKEKD